MMVMFKQVTITAPTHRREHTNHGGWSTCYKQHMSIISSSPTEETTQDLVGNPQFLPCTCEVYYEGNVFSVSVLLFTWGWRRGGKVLSHKVLMSGGYWVRKCPCPEGGGGGPELQNAHDGGLLSQKVPIPESGGTEPEMAHAQRGRRVGRA